LLVDVSTNVGMEDIFEATIGDECFHEIQFNSILYYLCAESTATRPNTDTAQYRYT
jgi:hypothetical protein